MMLCILVFAKPFGISPDDYEYIYRVMNPDDINDDFWVLSEPIFTFLGHIIYKLIGSAEITIKIIQSLFLLITLFFLSRLKNFRGAIFYFVGSFFLVQTLVLVRTGVALSFLAAFFYFTIQSRENKLPKLAAYFLSVLSHKQAIFSPIVLLINKFMNILSRYYLYTLFCLLLVLAIQFKLTEHLLNFVLNATELKQLNYYNDLSDGNTFGMEAGLGVRSYILLSALIVISMVKDSEYSVVLGKSGMMLALIFMAVFSPIPVISRRFFEFYSFASILLMDTRSRFSKAMLIFYSVSNFVIELYIYPLSFFDAKIF